MSMTEADRTTDGRWGTEECARTQDGSDHSDWAANG